MVRYPRWVVYPDAVKAERAKEEAEIPWVLVITVGVYRPWAWEDERVPEAGLIG